MKTGIVLALASSLILGAHATPSISQVPLPSSPFTHIPFSELESLLLSTPDEDNIKGYSRYYASGNHLAGKNKTQAEWTQKKFQEFGFEAEIVEYEVYLNYPKDHRLALLEEKDGETKVKFVASLKEDVLEEDPTTGVDQTPTFHGYSKSGNVTAQLVFANYGRFSDFEFLQANNVSVEGKIVIVKYGHVFRGLKVKRAEELGAIGVIIYTDPGDDGEISERNGYKTYPDGPARNPTAVQRGSVQYLSKLSGDPTTPGWASKPGCKRVDPYDYIPSIPSLPVAYPDAIPFLKALEGHGLNVSAIKDERWHQGGLSYKGVEYFVGPTPEHVKVNLYNEMENEFPTMWNVEATLPGYLTDEVVIFGNHRDAWITGGAADPNSGSAVMLELARTLGELVKAGWKPLRTIKLMSWDGEEAGLLGSTEWVEDKADWIKENVVAYLNSDVAAIGPRFEVSSNPLFEDLIVEASKKVVDPNSKKAGENKTVYELWDKKIHPMGSGSDFAPFQDFLGIPASDMGFTTAVNGTPYQYHSIYDSTTWMEKYGDPGYLYHAALVRVYGLTLLSLAEKPVLAFRAKDYGTTIAAYVEIIQDTLDGLSLSPVESADEALKALRHKIRVDLADHVRRFRAHAYKFDGMAKGIAKALENVPWWKFWEKSKLWIAARKINLAYKMLDRDFLYAEGLDGRPLFKHIIYAPGRWTGYAGLPLPGLVESIQDKNWTNGIRWADIVGESLEAAVERLGGKKIEEFVDLSDDVPGGRDFL